MAEVIKEIKISVMYKTENSSGRNDFNTLLELKSWLDKHPEHAKALGYTKTKQ